MVIYNQVKRHLLKQEKADLVTAPKADTPTPCPPGPPSPPPPGLYESAPLPGKDGCSNIMEITPDTSNTEESGGIGPPPSNVPSPLTPEAHAILAQQLQDAIEAKTKLENDLHAERLKNVQLENKLSLAPDLSNPKYS